MAMNPSHSLENRHALYLAATGQGKTTAMKQDPMLSPRPNRMISWDPGADHQVRKRVSDLDAFYHELLTQANAGQIDLGLTPDVSRADDFALVSQMIWQILDGNETTVFIVEEAAAVQPKTGKAGDAWGALVREGRKFGLVLLVTSQRSQEIDKTIFSQVGHLYVGPHSLYDAGKIAPYVGVQSDDIAALATGSFWHKTLGPEPPKLVQFSKK